MRSVTRYNAEGPSDSDEMIMAKHLIRHDRTARKEARGVKNVMRLLRRDFTRLITAPSALIVVLALIFLPSFYTWFNVAGFWNPYDNTGDLRVCVVNEDQGAESDLTGALNMGDQITEELSHNTQLGWVLTNRTDAMGEVRSGEAYAAFIIPSDFSRDTLTVLTGDFEQPKLEYYVNEKVGGVSTKITDTGATTLDETINSTFSSTVSETVVKTLDQALEKAQSDIDHARNGAAQQVGEVSESLGQARSSVADLNNAAQTASQKAQSAKEALQASQGDLDTLSSELQRASELLDSTQNALAPFIVSLMSSLDQSSALASQAASQTNASVGSVAGSISQAQGTIESTVDQGKAMVQMNESIIASLTVFAAALPDGAEKDALNQTIATLRTQNESLSTAINGVESSYASIATASNDVASASDALNTAIQGSLSASSDYRQVLTTSTFPALSDTATKLSSATHDLSTTVSNQKILVAQAIDVLDQLMGALAQTSSTLVATDGLLQGFQDDLSSVQTDLSALGTTSLLQELLGEESIDSGKVADFMSSPTQIETVSLYSVNAYGSAMAPLFMNLTLWIGVFMLLVILRQEVDDEGIARLTARQRYLGKLLFFAILASLQAIVCCTGNLILGVEVANIGLFYLTALIASLTYLSIQYGLSVLFQHVGKGLCVILIFVQIPGATGLYPIEMTPAFFQSIYPFFPFTYGINALRETIAGFYGSQWLMYMGVLLLFLGVFLALGLLLRPYFVNLNRMFAQQIKESDIFNGEEAQLPPRRYRWEKLFGALSDKQEYRAQIVSAIETFSRRYVLFKRWVVVVGIAVACASGVVLSLIGASKVLILTVWLVWLLVLLSTTLLVEHIHDRLEHERSLTSLSDQELQVLFNNKKGARASEQKPLSEGEVS